MFRQEKDEKHACTVITVFENVGLHMIVLQNIMHWKITKIKNLCFYVLQVLLNTTNQFQQIFC